MSRDYSAPHRSYTNEQKAEALGLAASVGPKRAAEHLGLPVRTVTYWTHQPASSVVMAAAEATIAERLKAAHAAALQAVMDGLRDPRSRLGDRATALRVLGEQLALAEGRATSNVELHSSTSPLDALSPDEQRQLADTIDTLFRQEDAQQALSVALVDPLSLTPVQIDNLIRAIEARIGDD